jgi:hypothetical protein
MDRPGSRKVAKYEVHVWIARPLIRGPAPGVEMETRPGPKRLVAVLDMAFEVQGAKGRLKCRKKIISLEDKLPW